MKGERGSNTMNITDVRVRKIAKEGKMKAVVSITIEIGRASCRERV